MSALDAPVIEVRAVFDDGTQHARFWTVNDQPHPDLGMDGGWPDWMVDPRRTWQHPQDPIVYSFLVAPGRESDARAWVDSL